MPLNATVPGEIAVAEVVSRLAVPAIVVNAVPRVGADRLIPDTLAAARAAAAAEKPTPATEFRAGVVPVVV